jgi:hypothetical protein
VAIHLLRRGSNSSFPLVEYRLSFGTDAKSVGTGGGIGGDRRDPNGQSVTFWESGRIRVRASAHRGIESDALVVRHDRGASTWGRNFGVRTIWFAGGCDQDGSSPGSTDSVVVVAERGRSRDLNDSPNRLLDVDRASERVSSKGHKFSILRQRTVFMTQEKDRYFCLGIGDHFSEMSPSFTGVCIANHQLGDFVEDPAWQESKRHVGNRVAFRLKSGEESSGFRAGVADEDLHP